MAPEPVCFSRFKHGRELAVDARQHHAWTGIVANGLAHVLDFHELLLVEDGRATVTLNGARSELRGPAAMLTGPGDVRRVEVHGPLRLRLVVFADDALQRLGAGVSPGRLPHGVVALPPDPIRARVCELADLMAGEIRRPWDDSALMLDALLAQLVVLLGRPAGTMADARRRPALLVALERLLERRFREEHRASAYAAMLGVTPDHLSAVIRAHDGVSAKTVIQRRVMREAVRLLRTTNHSVAAIAETLGYRDPGHFARAFRRATGVAPGRYRS